MAQMEAAEAAEEEKAARVVKAAMAARAVVVRADEGEGELRVARSRRDTWGCQPG